MNNCTISGNNDRQSYHILLGIYYETIINKINSIINKFNVDIIEFTGNIEIDLVKIKDNINSQIRKKITGYTFEKSNLSDVDIKKVDDIKNIVSTYLDYESFITNPDCFKKFNLKSNLNNLTKREKNLIYRSYICNQSLVHYETNRYFNNITKLMKAREKLKLTFINTESITDPPLIINE